MLLQAVADNRFYFLDFCWHWIIFVYRMDESREHSRLFISWLAVRLADLCKDFSPHDKKNWYSVAEIIEKNKKNS
jgi:hypothetical protein